MDTKIHIETIEHFRKLQEHTINTIPKSQLVITKKGYKIRIALSNIDKNCYLQFEFINLTQVEAFVNGWAAREEYENES